MVLLVLSNEREGRLLEESDYWMDGLFSPESRTAGRPLLSPLLVSASVFSLPQVCACGPSHLGGVAHPAQHRGGGESSWYRPMAKGWQ